MLLNLLLCLLLTAGVESNWDAKNNSPRKQNMGFNVMNMTCNDALDLCQNCEITPLFGNVFLMVVEYTKDPYKIQFSLEEGRQSRDWEFYQDDPDGMYRWCESAHSVASWDYPHSWRYTLCFENIFDNISVPKECEKPLVLLTHDSHYYDDEVRGQQMLYCMPSI